VEYCCNECKRPLWNLLWTEDDEELKTPCYCDSHKMKNNKPLFRFFSPSEWRRQVEARCNDLVQPDNNISDSASENKDS